MFNGLSERTGQQHSVIDVLTSMQSSAVTVRQERCAQVRNRNARCMKCAEACTSGCIGIVDGRLVIDASKCVGCGTCATVCPTCALEAHNPNDAELLAACRAAVSDGRAAIVCHQLHEALGDLLERDRAAQVVCLGRVEESLLAQLAADGVHQVQLCHGVCDSCAQRPGLDCACMVAESVNSLLAAWGSKVCVTVSDQVPAYALANGVSEQQARAAVCDYFSIPRANAPVVVAEAEEVLESKNDGGLRGSSSVVAEGAIRPAGSVVGPNSDAAPDHEPVKQAEISQDGTRKRTAPTTDAPAVLKVMKDGTLPHFLPDRRAKLLDALSDLGEPQADSIRTRLWGCVVINGAKCSSCRMCATFCPTGALSKFDREDGTFGVEHYPGDCVKCGTCRDICPEGAIMILDDVKPEYLLGGTVHTYRMKPRSVRLNNEHQIWRTMQLQTDGDIWER